MKKTGKTIWLYCLLLLISYSSFAQIEDHFDFSRQLWTGLRAPQKESELPKGNAPLQKAARVAKKQIPTVLKEQFWGEWKITNGWEMIDEEKVILSPKSVFDPSLNTSEWYNATVPGTVLTTLVNQGVYPDPYFGLNNIGIPESLSRTNWWYRTKFEVPTNVVGDKFSLVFNGINYASEIYLNGNKIGTTKGAFIRGNIDVTDYINQSGENILVVRVFPPTNPGIPHEQSMIAGQGLNGGMLSEDGPTFISSIGWDWIPGIRDRNTGIWQDVLLKNTSSVTIGDPLVTSILQLPDTTKASLKVLVPVKNITDKKVNGTLTATIPGTDVKLNKSYTLEPNQEVNLLFTPDEYKDLNLKNPRLWWPNGYGAQNLYNLNIEANVEGKVSDKKTSRFGIREMSYELMIGKVDNDIKSFSRVAYTPVKATYGKNRIFDYIDRIYYSEDIQVPTLFEGADTNCLETIDQNDPVGPYLVIRVNGERIFLKGGNWGMDDGMKRVSRERLEPYFRLHKDANFNIIRNWTGESTEEDFYALADEYGMLIWNDFWITTDDTVEPNDFVLFVDNARDTVKRFRNHPSIAIWCPRNEGFAPYELGLMLEDMVAKEDPTRHYHGQSRFLNMGTSGPWGYFKNPADYFLVNAQGLNTELGNYAIPTVPTIKKFLAPEDQWPINDVWAYHDMHHTTQNFGDFMDAVNRYGTPQSLDQFSKQAQFITYESWRYMLEAWNSKMWNNTTGLIYWMSHPAWPSFIWQTYTYDYETPGSYFGAKKAAEPVHIQMNLPNNEVQIINTTRDVLKGMTASVRYIDLNGKDIAKEAKKLTVNANGTTKCFDPLKVKDLPKMYLVRLELKDAKGKVVSLNDYWKTDGQAKSFEEINKLPKANCEISTKSYAFKNGARDYTVVTVTNKSNTIATNIKLNAVDPKTNEIILPAYFSNGYFNLLPNEKIEVIVQLPKPTSFNVVVDGYNVSQN